jgi:N-acetyl-anhydromuramyl-L-alanine amidase AmpD
MKIIRENLSFGSMSTRNRTRKLVLHHAAAKKCTIFDVHRWHKEKGWSGVGYYFFVRKDGSVYEGRPITKVGAHAYNYNSDSIGICFEGNFEVEKMPEAQKEAGKELVSYVLKKYPTITSVVGHRDLMATACPGKNFPFDEIKKGKKATSAPKVTITSTYTQEQFIRDVQSATGSEVDGIAGKETIGNTITVSKVFNRKHKVVKAIQKRLNALGYDCGAVDGIAGVLFESAVKRFQKANGCVVDGIISAQNKTWKKLLGMI